ncbi:hypothetical protein DXA97_11645 [Clostridium sp. OF09-36]|uniref:hypothetical protein n=1 Tax=Clostridium sp. OF09-36 TaxID=2292310 RepID=UPI000E4EA004|nr:hypothetical protein [Clostridium sp. OF09-36]RHV86902.1 hypothetical protein DXA97_11645 [Clostridium sp. OF09-36]
MGKIEDNLKKHIIEHYGSLKSFAAQIYMPYTTLDSIFKRGIKNSSVNNLVKIGSELGISINSLILEEKIVPYYPQDEIVKTPQYQKMLINNALVTSSQRDILNQLLDFLKREITLNDTNDIFTGIPEEDLLYYFWKLNSYGQETAIHRVSELTEINKYTDPDDAPAQDPDHKEE